MTRSAVGSLIFIALVNLAGMWLMSAKLEKMSVSLNVLAQRIQEQSMADPVAGELITAWKYQNGPNQSVWITKTTKNSGESTEDWKARHAAQVATDQGNHPPI
jgi:hypothetical protein